MSKFLVFLQFILIFLIAFPVANSAFSYLGIGVFSIGIVVFFRAILAMKRTTFTVLPEPKTGAELITDGIYGIVRHPMYLSVILCAIGASLFFCVWWKWWLAGMLLLILWLKIHREEKMLLARYDGYALYKQNTKALIPFIL